MVQRNGVSNCNCQKSFEWSLISSNFQVCKEKDLWGNPDDQDFYLEFIQTSIKLFQSMNQNVGD